MASTDVDQLALFLGAVGLLLCLVFSGVEAPAGSDNRLSDCGESCSGICQAKLRNVWVAL